MSAAATGLVCAAGACVRNSHAPTQTNGAPAKQLGVALLGLGDYAKTQLAPSLKMTKHCALRGIVTGTPGKVPEWQREFGFPDANVYDYQSLARIANNPSIDVVYVVTPTALHAKYAIMAAEAGKHVWCEKPMAMSVTECRSMIDACRKNGVSLSLGYRLHHEPNTQQITRWGKERPYGAIRKVSAIAGDKNDIKRGWRLSREMGGGALYDMGVYSINAIRYASGEEPVRVKSAKQWHERAQFADVDEVSEFELELPSGAEAFGRASRADSTNQLRIEAEHGWVQLEPMQAYDGIKGATSDGKTLDEKVDKQQRKQMDDEALAILEKRPPMVPGEEGLRDIRIIEAVIEAARLGRAVDL